MRVVRDDRLVGKGDRFGKLKPADARKLFRDSHDIWLISSRQTPGTF